MLRSAESPGSFAVNYAILGIAFVAEGISLIRAVRQTRAGPREAGLGFVEFVRTSREPATKVVVAEDTVAVVGLVVAFAGIALEQLTETIVSTPPRRSSWAASSPTLPTCSGGTSGIS